MRKFVEQVKAYGVEIKQEKVKGLHKSGSGFEIVTDKGRYCAQTLILAMGASSKNLGISGEDKFLGKGVSFCATCDMPLFKDKIVAIVGGGDSAVTGAIHATKFARQVYLIHRRSEFRAEPAWVERLKKEKNVSLVLENQVEEIKGEERVTGLVLKKPFEGKTQLQVDGIFIEIGQVASSFLAQQLRVELDEQSFVKITPGMETNIAGIFAAGDLASIPGRSPLRQFVTSAADGARAAAAAYQYLHKAVPAPSWGLK